MRNRRLAYRYALQTLGRFGRGTQAHEQALRLQVRAARYHAARNLRERRAS